MQGIDLTDEEKRVFPEYPWCALRKAIARAANKYTDLYAKALTSAKNNIFPDIGADWIGDRLKEPTVLILDGIDDFLSKHPRVTLAHLSQMLDKLRTEHGTEHRLTVILGARSSQPGLRGLVLDPWEDAREILRLSPAQADRYFPGIAEVIARVSSRRLRDLLLTPLILSKLWPGIEEPSASRLSRLSRLSSLRTRSGIMEEALRAIFIKRNLPRGTGADGNPFEIEAWLDAAMLVAWRFFLGFRGVMGRDTVRGEVAADETHFRAHLDRHPDLDRGSVMQGFEIVRTDEHFDRLLRGTVFFPTGTSTSHFRIVHREWEEFLVGRFLATCLRARNVDAPGAQALTKNVIEYAGEQWYDPERDRDRTMVDVDLLHDVMHLAAGRPGPDEKPTETPNQYVVGCFASTLAYSTVPLGPRVIQHLFAGILNTEELARHVALHTLTFRCLRASRREKVGDPPDPPDPPDGIRKEAKEPPDPSADDIREVLVPTLVWCLKRPETNAITRSLAWCGLRALHELYPDSLEPPCPWPGLGRREEPGALQMLCPPRPAGWVESPAAVPLAQPGYRPDRKQASLQTVYLRVQAIVLVQPFNAITTVHGMYGLATALRNGGAIDEAGGRNAGIAVMLAEDSEITKAVKKDAELMGIHKELMAIWEHCRWACSEAGRDAPLALAPPPG